MVPILLGSLFGLMLYHIWSLPGRWFVVAIGGLLLISVSMILIYRFSDFLLIFLMFIIPLSGFCKWLFLKSYTEEVANVAPLSGCISLGITDFILVGLYLSWFIKIFVTKEERLPRLTGIDKLVLLLVVSYIISLLGAPHLSLGLFATGHLIKHVMIYFYVSRHIKGYHIRWFMATLFCAIVLQASLGITQNRTGRFAGLMIDKGAGKHIDDQYIVPGIENYTRATGTTYDSHSLGLYLAMLIPYAFVFSVYTPSIKWGHRLLSGLAFLLAAVTLVLTFSRSGWLSCGFSLCVTIAVFFKWGDKYIIPTLIGAFIISLPLAPWAISHMYERLFHAPDQIMTARYDQCWVALRMWRDHFLFGIGAGNYMEVLKTYRTSSEMLLPVHNVFLWVGSDTGLFGVVAFYGVILSAIRRLWKLVKVKHSQFSRVALAALTGLVAFLLDGLTNPAFREAVVYMMFWFTISLSVALPQIEHDRRFSEVNQQAKLSGE
jgi:hypothetical protein